MTKLTERDLHIALANQYSRLGMSKPWGEENQELAKANQIMKEYDITIEDITNVCGTSEIMERIDNMEKNALLQGNKFIACIHGWFYVMDYDLNLTGF